MPNHITNKLTFLGDATALREFVKGEERAFDFQKIIPMPAHIFRGNLSQEDEEKHGPENCWYDWSIKRWGTKWNCYDHREEGESLIFETAWATPLPIFVALSSKFPDVQIKVEYADEDIGSNLGIVIYHNGSYREEKVDDPIRFACDLVSWADYDDYMSDREERSDGS